MMPHDEGSVKHVEKTCSVSQRYSLTLEDLEKMNVDFLS